MGGRNRLRKYAPQNWSRGSLRKRHAEMKKKIMRETFAELNRQAHAIDDIRENVSFSTDEQAAANEITNSLTKLDRAISRTFALTVHSPLRTRSIRAPTAGTFASPTRIAPAYTFRLAYIIALYFDIGAPRLGADRRPFVIKPLIQPV
jgi:small-conductance mechanosensitive channel